MRWIPAVRNASLAALMSVAAFAGDSRNSNAAEAQPERIAKEDAGRGTRVRLGGITVGAGYSHFSGFPPYFGPAYSGWPHYWGAYDLLFYPSYGWLGGFVHPGYYRDYRQGAGMGQVKLRTADKLAPVYLDGGYAGVAKDLKTIWLSPGAYNLELRTDNESFSQRIYVLSGKTVRVDAELTPAQEKHP